MSLIRDEDRCYCIIGVLLVVSSLFFVITVCCRCCAFLALCCVHFCVLCFALTASSSLGLCVRRVWVCALFCASLVPLNVAFWIELRANRFLQGGSNRQPTNDRANTTTSEDRVWRFQHMESSMCNLACSLVSPSLLTKHSFKQYSQVLNQAINMSAPSRSSSVANYCNATDYVKKVKL